VLTIAPLAVLFATTGDVSPAAAGQAAQLKAEQAATAAVVDGQCCVEVVAVSSHVPAAERTMVYPGTLPPATQPVAPVGVRLIDVPQLLPIGDAPESGLQVKTILASRSISVDFPEIHNIGGVRPDSLRWHPDGLALDVMIPNPSSAEGIALGDRIVQYVMANAQRFGIQDAIWRDVYYTPGGGANRSGMGHYDHVHITTTGGGYPTGSELFYR